MARKKRDVIIDEFCTPKRERPIQRNAANARERARMRVLSKAFSRLKTSLPWVPADTKLSKLDTLRLAASYIAHLRQILKDEPQEPCSVHPITLTWPFSFQSRQSEQMEIITKSVGYQNDYSDSCCEYVPQSVLDFHSQVDISHFL